LITPNVKNQVKATASKGDAFASFIRAANRKPRKPAAPKTVTAKSAVAAVRALALRPIPFPSMSSTNRMVTKT
jgi:hypothetical protein